MKVTLDAVSKRFQNHWIFKNISTEYAPNSKSAILGNNGSGKSTLLRIISGMQNPSKGKISYLSSNQTPLKQDQIFSYLSYTAPGQELIEEFTLLEFLAFHGSFKKMINDITPIEILKLIGLEKHANLTLNDCSSGMKQRIKLAQAIFAETPLLLLDEPCTNLDQLGIEQYRSWMESYTQNRTVIIASNDVREYFFCTQQLSIQDYK